MAGVRWGDHLPRSQLFREDYFWLPDVCKCHISVSRGASSMQR